MAEIFRVFKIKEMKPVDRGLRNKPMKILWVNTTTQVTRTFVEAGKTED